MLDPYFDFMLELNRKNPYLVDGNLSKKEKAQRKPFRFICQIILSKLGKPSFEELGSPLVWDSEDIAEVKRMQNEWEDSEFERLKEAYQHIAFMGYEPFDTSGIDMTGNRQGPPYFPVLSYDIEVEEKSPSAEKLYDRIYLGFRQPRQSYFSEKLGEPPEQPYQ